MNDLITYLPQNHILQVIGFRNARDSDLPFIADAMYHSFNSRKDLINKLCKSFINQITIAHDINNDDQIISFMCADVNEIAIHFVYTKLAFRRMNIAHALYKHLFTNREAKYYTLNCKLPNNLVGKFHLKYKPILLFSSLFKE